MKKRIVGLLVASMMVFSLVGCGGSNETPANSDAGTEASTGASTG